MGDGIREWDEKEVLEAVAKRFGHKAEEIEGPARLGDCRAWRAWTYDAEGDEYHAHYAVAHGDDPLKFYRTFAHFADWMHDAFTLAANLPVEEAKHARRLEIVRIGIASIVVLTLLGLVVLQVGVRNSEGLNVSHIVSVLLGAGVAYLLGGWVRKPRQ